MKILLLNYEFPPIGGGGSPASFQIAKGLSETGAFDIDVITMAYKESPRFEEVNDSLRIFRVSCLRSKKEISYPWEQLTYLISAYFKCRALMKKNSYDVCHCHFIIPTGVLALVLKKQYGLKYVLSAHGSDVIGYNPRFKRLYPLVAGIWKKILDGAEKIIVPSQFLKREIVKVYPSIEKIIEVIPHGIQAGTFLPMKKEKYILLVSRLFINKGIQDFIEAIRGVDLTGWEIKIVGEGPYREALETLVKRYHLESKVTFLGWIDNKSDVLKTLYGTARVFVSPSWFESMNMTLLEAMQAGCAVIASDAGANPELVGDSGMLYAVKDERMLRERLETCIGAPELMENLGTRVAEQVSARFGVDGAILGYKRLFEHI